MERSLNGYKKKPASITVIAVIFLLLPLPVLCEALLRSGASSDVLRGLLSSRYFLREWALSWSAAAAVYIVSRWSFAYFIALSGMVLAERLSHVARHPDLENPLSALMTGIWFAVVGFVLLSSLRLPYLNPKLRWWTRPPRMALGRHAAIIHQGTPIPAIVLNLSRGGAFVKLDASAAARRHFPQQLGASCALSMPLGSPEPASKSAPPVSLPAQLVWMAKPGSPYRSGVGIKFTSLSPQQQRQLRRFLADAPRHAGPVV